MLESIILIFLTQLIFFFFYLVRILYPVVNKIEFYPVIGQEPLTMVQRFDLVVANCIHYVQYNLFDSFFNRLVVQYGVLSCYSCVCRGHVGVVLSLGFLLTQYQPEQVSLQHEFIEVGVNLKSDNPDFYENMHSNLGKHIITMYTARDKMDPCYLYESKASFAQTLKNKGAVLQREFIGDSSQFYRLFYYCSKEFVRAVGTVEATSMFQESKLGFAMTDNLDKPHCSYVKEHRYNAKEQFVTYEMSAMTTRCVPKGTQPYAEFFARHALDQYCNFGNLQIDGLQSPGNAPTFVHGMPKISEITPELIEAMQKRVCTGIQVLQADIQDAYAKSTFASIHKHLHKVITNNRILLQLFDLYPEKMGANPELALLQQISMDVLQLDTSFCEARVFSVLTYIPEVLCSNSESVDKVQVGMQKVVNIPTYSPMQAWNNRFNSKFFQEIQPQVFFVNRALRVMYDPLTLQCIAKTFVQKFLK